MVSESYTSALFVPSSSHRLTCHLNFLNFLKLGAHFDLDLTYRKAEVKLIITDVISNMTDEDDDEEDTGEDAEGDGEDDTNA